MVARSCFTNNGDFVPRRNDFQLYAGRSRSIEHVRAINFHLLALTMSLSPLLPISAAVLKPLAERAIDSLANGLSFLDVLRHQESNADAPSEPDGSHDQPFDLGDFVGRLREQFASLGIDPETPIRLKQNGNGGVIVDGEHPDRVLIEGLFAAENELTELFNTLALAAASEQELDEDFTVEDVRLQIDRFDADISFA